MQKLLLLIPTILFLSGCGGSGSSDEMPPPVTPPPVASDTTPPQITLNGEQTMSHEQGTTFSDPGATATDDTDGTVDVVVTGSVGSDAGSYTLTYTATDAAGNSATVTREVVVADTQSPTVSLVGSAVVEVTQGETYQENGATASDSVDGAIEVSTSGSVDTSTVGTYIITYTASDSAGNETSITRTVNVIAPPSTGDEIVVFQQGQVGSRWESGMNAFDAAIDYAECSNDGGAACPSISWSVVSDNERGDVLEISHSDSGDLAGFFIKTASPVDLSSMASGALLFDIKSINGNGQFTMKLDCEFPCTSGNQQLNITVDNNWTNIIIPLAELQTSGLDLTKVDTGLVIWASSHNGDTFRLDNVRFESSYSGDSSIGGTTQPPNNVTYSITQYGAGSISDTINPASYRCVFDFGNWIYNAGVVAPGIADCITATGTPIGEPTPLSPQVTGEAAELPLASHRWWGSVSFMGEMTIGDPNNAAYITPDPITARVSNAGFRMMGIPNGLSVYGIDFGYRIPDPFSEVFDGMGIANSMHNNMQAYASKTSDGSVTVEWQAQNQTVMTATFVHGSPYVFVNVLEGELQLKTLRADGGEKGVYHQSADSLGIWTSVAGNTNHFLITGDGDTAFTNANGNLISVSNPTQSYTIALMPSVSDTPSAQMIATIKQYARNEVASVKIDYTIDDSTSNVVISQQFLDASGAAIETLAGLQPLHWKHLTSAVTSTSLAVRSARGVTKFSPLSEFSYSLPHVGVLPTLPAMTDNLDVDYLTALVNEFVEAPTSQWNTYNDTYWSGKMYGKIAELIAIADSIGLTEQKTALITYLKVELENWFTAETDGNLDTNKYFVYDDQWNTLLGMEESFAAHQQLNDHHFHYGYFVRAATEICRHEATWCDANNYGPMIELLIRDYAGGRDDPMFPYLRHFDPANGFSWASGNVNFVRGNNNESTSEAANAYGAMVLYGLITGNDAIKDRGMYLHASTSASFWQYWNNIDGYNNTNGDVNEDNFPAGYSNITTSIVWGDGAVFSTWFSAAYAHILGIQSLPTNTLNLHIGIHPEYLQDYVDVGLFESSNGKPSGLIDDQWRDIWWNIWALTDPTASINDYNTVNAAYIPEAGESKAHTYHWITTFDALGHMAMGTGDITADHPAALVFDKNGVKTYVVYNYGSAPLTVNYSDGAQVTAQPNSFAVSDGTSN